MKHFLLFATFLLLSLGHAQAQDLRWLAQPAGHRQFLSARVGADYAMVSGISYGRLRPGKHPAALSIDLSLPFGDELFDDWKGRLSTQAELWHQGRFHFTASPSLVVRRYGSDIAQLLNIGGELGLALAFHQNAWSYSLEAGYDQAFATKLNHGRLREYYPGIYNGWVGATGGNLKFGGQVARSLGPYSAWLRLGKTFARNFQDNPTLPFYAEIGVARYW